MLQQKSPIVAYDAGPLGYLVTIRKALPILLSHKIHDPRLHRFLSQVLIGALAFAAAGVCFLTVVPPLWVLVAILPAVVFFGFALWLDVGDLFLRFAMEDPQFFEAAAERSALSVFEGWE